MTIASSHASPQAECRAGFRRDRNKFLRILEEQGRYRRDVWSCSMMLLLCHPAVRRFREWESYDGSEGPLPFRSFSKWIKSVQSRKTEAKK